MAFQDDYFKILNIVKDDIEIVNKKLVENIEMDEPLKSKLIEFLNTPSKRTRPLLAFLYIRAKGMKPDYKQYSLQTAIELAHNASLIHDDIIDECSIRRFKETLNAKFGNKLAVISGDYLLSDALNKISKLNSPELLTMFSETLACMCQGEITQHFNKFKIPTIEEYIIKSKHKTAKLFQTAIEGAAIISSIPERQEAQAFGENFGIAFQIRDDLINAKTTQTDIKDGIYNAPVIFSNDKNNVDNGLEKTYLLLNNYIDKAFEAISDIADNKYKRAITELLGIFRND